MSTMKTTPRLETHVRRIIYYLKKLSMTPHLDRHSTTNPNQKYYQLLKPDIEFDLIKEINTALSMSTTETELCQVKLIKRQCLGCPYESGTFFVHLYSSSFIKNCVCWMFPTWFLNNDNLLIDDQKFSSGSQSEPLGSFHTLNRRDTLCNLQFILGTSWQIFRADTSNYCKGWRVQKIYETCLGWAAPTSVHLACS